MDAKEKVEAVKGVWGERFFDDYMSWLFEYAWQESRFLGIHYALDEESYLKAMPALYSIRRQTALDRLVILSKALHEQTKIDYSRLHKHFMVPIPNRNRIQALIHRNYYQGQCRFPRVEAIETDREYFSGGIWCPEDDDDIWEDEEDNGYGDDLEEE